MKGVTFLDKEHLTYSISYLNVSNLIGHTFSNGLNCATDIGVNLLLMVRQKGNNLMTCVRTILLMQNAVLYL